MKKENISDSALYDHHLYNGERRSTRWLRVAYNAYCRLQRFRDVRRENKDYAYGRQYRKTIVVNGTCMTKEEYLKSRGIPALQMNMLGKIKRSVQGQFRLNSMAPVCTSPDPNEKEYAEVMSSLLKQNMKMNKRNEKDARTFEEFLISGFAVYKISWAYRKGKMDVFTDYVNPNYIFYPDDIDFSLDNIRFCGMLHDLDFSEVLSLFSHSDEDDQKLKECYNHCWEQEYILSQYSTDERTNDIANTDFFWPREYGKCRVIELWTKERRKAWFCYDPLEEEPYFVPYEQKADIERINSERMNLNIKRNPDGTMMYDENGRVMTFMDPSEFKEKNCIKYERRIETYWYYRYMTPDGYILEEGQSPYWNGGESFHPFVFKPYPYIDAEFHSFISEMIPAQEYFNYYMIALDFYIRNAAKGVLMIDEQSLSDQMSIDDIAEQYVKTDGIIIYTSKKGGKVPETKTAGSIPGGFDYIIQLSRSMTDDISGVNAAMQGKKAGDSGVLYQTQIAQATMSVLDLLKSYSSFLEDVARKVIKVMQCFYTGIKTVSIAGEPLQYNMDTMHDVDLDISISEDADSPVYRALSNSFLMQAAQAGQIPFRVALESGDFYNSQKILSALDRYEMQLKQIQEQQAAAQQPTPA